MEHKEAMEHFVREMEIERAPPPCLSALKAAIEVKTALEAAKVWGRHDGNLSPDSGDESVWLDWWNMRVNCHFTHGGGISIGEMKFGSVDEVITELTHILRTHCRVCGIKPDSGEIFRTCNKCKLVAYCSIRCESSHLHHIHAPDCQ